MPSLLQYLPSGQFASIAGSIAIGGGLILGAQYLSAPQAAPQLAAQTAVQETEDWQKELDLIQLASPGLPEPPSQEAVQGLLAEARSGNITDTVARSLLVNLTSASSQGLGADIPTQERLIAEAVKELPDPKPLKTYTSADLKASGAGAADQKRYGNAVIEAFGRHQGATSQATLTAVSEAADTNSAQKLAVLADIQAEYEALVRDLADIPVPATLAPLHAQVLNAVGAAAASFDDMQALLKDPLRGLGGLQRYELKMGEAGRVFTAIAGILNKNGILFDKSEPGAAWDVFLST